MEFVFVVPRTALFPERYPHGFERFGEERPIEAFLERVESHGFFVERDYAEKTPSLKQVIPYCIVTREREVLCLRRSSKGGEARLHDKLSIGVGGHINPVDLPAPAGADKSPQGGRRNPIPNATRREVAEEELELIGDWDVQTLGLINDDSNPVGAVHVGLVQRIQVSGDVRVRETDQLEGSFRTLAEFDAMRAGGANFETWSEMLIGHLDQLLPQTVRS